MFTYREKALVFMNLQRFRDGRWLFFVITLTALALLVGVAPLALQRAASGQADPGGHEQAPLVTAPDANSVPFANHTAVQHPMTQWQPPLSTTSKPGQLIAYNLQTRQERLVNPSTTQATTSSGAAGAGAVGAAGAADVPLDVQSPNRFSSLSQVSNVSLYPWRTIVKLFVYHDELGNNSYYACSGALIDPYHVITSGECVFDRGSPNGGYGWAAQIVVAPAYRDGNAPYGTAVAINDMFSFTSWTQNGNLDGAIGYIRLDRPIGALSGWLGYGYNVTDSHFLTNTFQNTGYPTSGSYTGARMYNWSGPFDFVFPDRLEQTNLLNDGGFNGSSAFLNPSDPRLTRVQAIYTYYTTDTNRTGYTRLTQDKVNLILSELSGYLPNQVDLVPMDVNVTPDVITAGTSFSTLNYFIENYSNQVWNGVVDVEIYLSTDNQISNQDTLLSTETTAASNNITARDGLRVTSNQPPPLPTNLAAGQYWVGILLKDPNTARANNVSNGWDAAPITIQAAPTPTPTRTPTPTTTPTASPTFVDTPTATTAPPTETATPTPTATATETATTTATETATATATATLDNPPGGSSNTTLYLPAIVRVIVTPIITVTPVWQRIAGANLRAVKVALQGETLLVGTRGNNTDPTRGLYSGNATNCTNGVTLGRVRAIPVGSVFDIILRGANGVTTSYDDGIFYTGDGGATWQSGVPAVERPRTVAIVTDVFFVGTEDNGVYLSRDGGHTWEQRRNEPKNINGVKLDVKAPDLLWIGTHEAGVYSLRIGNTDIFAQNQAGLSGKALNIWDFAFATTQIYLATEGGVFVGDGVGPWTPFGPTPPGVAFYSLELVGNTLYAGAENNGVWQKALTGGDWTRVSAPGWNDSNTVRDLLYDTTHCQGLLAATNDGIWLYR